MLLSRGDQLALSDHYAHKEIRTKCELLQRQWQELSTVSSLRYYINSSFSVCLILQILCREKKLEESLAFQEFCASINEEESWVTEKIAVQQSEDFGDSLGAVQVCLFNIRMSGTEGCQTLANTLHMYICKTPL